MRQNLLELPNKYLLSFGDISISEANQVDFDSIDNFFSENNSILKNIKFKILSEKEVVFNSDTDYYGLLSYNIAIEICNILRDFLYMKPKEVYAFENLCKTYLKDPQKNKMPIEMLIAQNMQNKNTFISAEELLSMEVKKYEKIQIALRILNGQDY